jgi:hypothetical protein
MAVQPMSLKRKRWVALVTLLAVQAAANAAPDVDALLGSLLAAQDARSRLLAAMIARFYDARIGVSAEPLFRDAIERAPDDVVVIFVAASLCGREETAPLCPGSEVVEHLTELDPDNAAAWGVRAEHAARLGRDDEALAFIRQAARSRTYNEYTAEQAEIARRALTDATVADTPIAVWEDTWDYVSPFAPGANLCVHGVHGQTWSEPCRQLGSLMEKAAPEAFAHSFGLAVQRLLAASDAEREAVEKRENALSEVRRRSTRAWEAHVRNQAFYASWGRAALEEGELAALYWAADQAPAAD